MISSTQTTMNVTQERWDEIMESREGKVEWVYDGHTESRKREVYIPGDFFASAGNSPYVHIPCDRTAKAITRKQ